MQLPLHTNIIWLYIKDLYKDTAGSFIYICSVRHTALHSAAGRRHVHGSRMRGETVCTQEARYAFGQLCKEVWDEFL